MYRIDSLFSSTYRPRYVLANGKYVFYERGMTRLLDSKKYIGNVYCVCTNSGMRKQANIAYPIYAERFKKYGITAEIPLDYGDYVVNFSYHKNNLGKQRFALIMYLCEEHNDKITNDVKPFFKEVYAFIGTFEDKMDVINKITDNISKRDIKFLGVALTAVKRAFTKNSNNNLLRNTYYLKPKRRLHGREIGLENQDCDPVAQAVQV